MSWFQPGLALTFVLATETALVIFFSKFLYLRQAAHMASVETRRELRIS